MSETVTLVKLAALEQIRTDTVAANVAAVTPIKTAAEVARDDAQAASGTATTQAGVATSQAALATTNGAAQVALAAAQVSLATTQATNALNSANAAAISATTALNAIAQQFKGGIAASALPATSSLAGDTYRITIAGGVFQGKTWAIGDAAIYNGTSGSWTQLTGFYAGATAYTDAIISPIAATRQLSSYFQSDGASANRGVVYTNATRQNIAGAQVVEIAIDMMAPSVPPTTDAVVFLSAPGASILIASSLAIRFLSTGTTDIICTDATSSANYRRFSSGTFRAAYSGQRIRTLVTLTAGTTDPVIRVNNEDKSSLFSLTSSNPPAWLSGISSAFQIAGFNWPAAEPPTVVPILGSLSTTERTEYFATGRLPAWVNAGGSAVSTVPVGNAAALGANDGTSIPQTTGQGGGGLNCSAELGARPLGVGAKVLKLLAVGSGAFFYTPTFLKVQRGIAPFFYRCWARRTVGTFTQAAIGCPAANNALAPNILLTADWAQYSGIAYTNDYLGGRIVFAFFGNSAGDAWEIDDLEIIEFGALTLPGVQGIGTARDLTALGGTQPNQGRLVGVRPVLAQPSPNNIAVLPLSTTEGYLTLGSGNPLAFTPQRIIRAEVVLDTAGATLTLRNNAPTGFDIITAATVIAAANTATQLTLIAAQTRLAAGATVWADISAGTGYLVLETTDTL